MAIPVYCADHYSNASGGIIMKKRMALLAIIALPTLLFAGEEVPQDTQDAKEDLVRFIRGVESN
jgi:hypothetical protein